MLMVVDDVVFSMEVWNWYHERRDRVKGENDVKINVFRPWLKEKHRAGEEYMATYGEFQGYDFYEFLHEIFMLFTDIQLTPIERHHTIKALHDELIAIEDMVLYWALTEDHERDEFGPDMRNELLNDKTMSFNRKFHIESCYKMKAIWEGFNSLKAFLGPTEVKDIPEVDIFKMVDIIEDHDMDEFIKNIIRLGYGGDFDEFIISVMERIKFLTMKENHEKLAMIKGYEIFGIEDFETKLPYSETWRRLFTNYFDEVEDIFKLFYERFVGPCVLFLYNDYLSWDDMGGIKYIPIYKLYTNESQSQCSTNIRFFIDQEKIRNRIFKLYKVRINQNNIICDQEQ